MLNKIEQHLIVFCKRLEKEKHLCVKIRFGILIHESRVFCKPSEANQSINLSGTG